MKKFLCFFISIFLCFIFVACEKTQSDIPDILDISDVSDVPDIPDGVPDSLILRNVSVEENVTYDINHKYDSETHIDDVELVTSYNGDFGVQTKTYTYSYQYDQSSDLWSLIGNSNGLQSDSTTLDPNAFIGKSFKGRFAKAYSGQYNIYARDLDLTNKIITIDYTIIFDDGDVLYNTATTDIVSFSDGTGLGFNIEYTRSFVVRFGISFSLDMFEGICT